jgi:hypothetical protein
MRVMGLPSLEPTRFSSTICLGALPDELLRGFFFCGDLVTGARGPIS